MAIFDAVSSSARTSSLMRASCSRTANHALVVESQVHVGVLDVQFEVFAHLLDSADDLAGVPLALDVLGERGVDIDDAAAVQRGELRSGDALGRLAAEFDHFLGEVDVLTERLAYCTFEGIE